MRQLIHLHPINPAQSCRPFHFSPYIIPPNPLHLFCHQPHLQPYSLGFNLLHHLNHRVHQLLALHQAPVELVDKLIQLVMLDVLDHDKVFSLGLRDGKLLLVSFGLGWEVE